MEDASNNRVSRQRFGKREVIVTALICILIVSGLGYIYYTKILTPKRDVVGVIKIEGPILTFSDASRYTDIINQAMLNESVKAVVLLIDSPGGYADLIEQIHLDLLQLKEKKPLVASIVMALSGGYYIAVAADYIYVHNTSYIGNIGVIGVGPPVLIPSEEVMETGAYKVTGFSTLLFPYNLSHVLDSFVSAVEMGRGDRLKLSPTHLRRGLIYLGSEAVKTGLADEIGSLQKAIKKVAEKARLVKYEIIELRSRELGISESWRGLSNYTSVKWRNLTVEALSRLYPPPAIYYLYLPPETLTHSSSSPAYFARTVDTSSGRDEVLIDISHGNQISWWELDILIAELAKRDVTVSFVSRWEDMDSKLDSALALMVFSPTETYSAEERDRIEKFVRGGSLLLLFFDPAWEHIGLQGLWQGIIAPINSISTLFGLSFAKGYLYNEVEQFGIYRNIYVRNFTASPLTRNLRSIVLFTATHIYSMGNGVAWASNNTYSSVAEKVDNYAVIVWVERGNGTVAAFGDLTFLREPYCNVEDNYKLILNIVSLITIRKAPVEEVKEGVREEVARPDLPVGTEKNYTEWVDGKESLVRWLKVSETEVRVERPNRTTHYYTEDDALWRWVSNGMECIYDSPLPEPPYPLTKGERWKYESNYTLTFEGKEYKGKIAGEEDVEGFEDIVAGDNKRYFSARVMVWEVEQLVVNGTNMTMITTGRYWFSSEAGTVKQEATTKYYMNSLFTGEERRTLLLESIRKGKEA